ncbi:cyclopropane fatty acyl phospholipid synthase [Chlorobium ferrooxidans]|uniref:Cyclopropane-fatty-acyl-phospholipid synthase n=1 Tax=Chlorobium ferrooxidans DSM 13031 TaxID=377431 RepID=Q0YQ11_9CHLB|nr:cyclopropane fatty acyl phospholipid synthase [Chlorobium ferrooxidans]EAT58382.1 Cyclopropane-fatty-acyl-phospholipid synthase [Chlorobium ferrooxidans DSM 13031]
MLNGFYKRVFERILDDADVKIGGERAWDIRIHNEALYRRVITQGNLGLGEAYMEGWWDCEQLEEFFHRVIDSKAEHKLSPPVMLIGKVISKLYNMQRPSRAFRVAEKHYNIGNDLFKAMLDKRMLYSCGYWKEANSLEESQEKKLHLIFQKLQLKPGMQVLDIGCGWGGAAQFAAQHYGVSVHGVTVSTEQAAIARDYCAAQPVTIEVVDYRRMRGSYDRIYSIGMFEHVGYKNYREYFKISHECLKEEGLMLLHTIGGNTSSTSVEPWANKYIFPNANIPSATQIAAGYEGLFTLEDWHVFTHDDYARTLMAWYENIEKQWPMLPDRYDETFQRMWRYYLLSCTGGFRSRTNQLWQLLLSKNGIRACYTIPR